MNHTEDHKNVSFPGSPRVLQANNFHASDLQRIAMYSDEMPYIPIKKLIAESRLDRDKYQETVEDFVKYLTVSDDSSLKTDNAQSNHYSEYDSPKFTNITGHFHNPPMHSINILPPPIPNELPNRTIQGNLIYSNSSMSVSSSNDPATSPVSTPVPLESVSVVPDPSVGMLHCGSQTIEPFLQNSNVLSRSLSVFRSCQGTNMSGIVGLSKDNSRDSQKPDERSSVGLSDLIMARTASSNVENNHRIIDNGNKIVPNGIPVQSCSVLSSFISDREEEIGADADEVDYSLGSTVSSHILNLGISSHSSKHCSVSTSPPSITTIVAYTNRSESSASSARMDVKGIASSDNNNINNNTIFINSQNRKLNNKRDLKTETSSVIMSAASSSLYQEQTGSISSFNSESTSGSSSSVSSIVKGSWTQCANVIEKELKATSKSQLFLGLKASLLKKSTNTMSPPALCKKKINLKIHKKLLPNDKLLRESKSFTLISSSTSPVNHCKKECQSSFECNCNCCENFQIINKALATHLKPNFKIHKSSGSPVCHSKLHSEKEHLPTTNMIQVKEKNEKEIGLHHNKSLIGSQKLFARPASSEEDNNLPEFSYVCCKEREDSTSACPYNTQATRNQHKCRYAECSAKKTGNVGCYSENANIKNFNNVDDDDVFPGVAVHKVYLKTSSTITSPNKKIYCDSNSPIAPTTQNKIPSNSKGKTKQQQQQPQPQPQPKSISPISRSSASCKKLAGVSHLDLKLGASGIDVLVEANAIAQSLARPRTQNGETLFNEGCAPTVRKEEPQQHELFNYSPPPRSTENPNSCSMTLQHFATPFIQQDSHIPSQLHHPHQNYFLPSEFEKEIMAAEPLRSGSHFTFQKVIPRESFQIANELAVQPILTPPLRTSQRAHAVVHESIAQGATSISRYRASFPAPTVTKWEESSLFACAAANPQRRDSLPARLRSPSLTIGQSLCSMSSSSHSFLPTADTTSIGHQPLLRDQTADLLLPRHLEISEAPRSSVKGSQEHWRHDCGVLERRLSLLEANLSKSNSLSVPDNSTSEKKNDNTHEAPQAAHQNSHILCDESACGIVSINSEVERNNRNTTSKSGLQEENGNSKSVDSSRASQRQLNTGNSNNPNSDIIEPFNINNYEDKNNSKIGKNVQQENDNINISKLISLLKSLDVSNSNPEIRQLEKSNAGEIINASIRNLDIISPSIMKVNSGASVDGCASLGNHSLKQEDLHQQKSQPNNSFIIATAHSVIEPRLSVSNIDNRGIRTNFSPVQVQLEQHHSMIDLATNKQPIHQREVSTHAFPITLPTNQHNNNHTNNNNVKDDIKDDILNLQHIQQQQQQQQVQHHHHHTPPPLLTPRSSIAAPFVPSAITASVKAVSQHQDENTSLHQPRQSVISNKRRSSSASKFNNQHDHSNESKRVTSHHPDTGARRLSISKIPEQVLAYIASSQKITDHKSTIETNIKNNQHTETNHNNQNNKEIRLSNVDKQYEEKKEIAVNELPASLLSVQRRNSTNPQPPVPRLSVLSNSNALDQLQKSKTANHKSDQLFPSSTPINQDVARNNSIHEDEPTKKTDKKKHSSGKRYSWSEINLIPERVAGQIPQSMVEYSSKPNVASTSEKKMKKENVKSPPKQPSLSPSQADDILADVVDAVDDCLTLRVPRETRRACKLFLNLSDTLFVDAFNLALDQCLEVANGNRKQVLSWRDAKWVVCEDLMLDIVEHAGEKGGPAYLPHAEEVKKGKKDKTREMGDGTVNKMKGDDAKRHLNDADMQLGNIEAEDSNLKNLFAKKTKPLKSDEKVLKNEEDTTKKPKKNKIVQEEKLKMKNGQQQLNENLLESKRDKKSTSPNKNKNDLNVKEEIKPDQKNKSKKENEKVLKTKKDKNNSSSESSEIETKPRGHKETKNGGNIETSAPKMKKSDFYDPFSTATDGVFMRNTNFLQPSNDKDSEKNSTSGDDDDEFSGSEYSDEFFNPSFNIHRSKSNKNDDNKKISNKKNLQVLKADSALSTPSFSSSAVLSTSSNSFAQKSSIQNDLKAIGRGTKYKQVNGDSALSSISWTQSASDSLSSSSQNDSVGGSGAESWQEKGVQGDNSIDWISSSSLGSQDKSSSAHFRDLKQKKIGDGLNHGGRWGRDGIRGDSSISYPSTFSTSSSSSNSIVDSDSSGGSSSLDFTVGTESLSQMLHTTNTDTSSSATMMQLAIARRRRESQNKFQSTSKFPSPPRRTYDDNGLHGDSDSVDMDFSTNSSSGDRTSSNSSDTSSSSTYQQPMVVQYNQKGAYSKPTPMQQSKINAILKHSSSFSGGSYMTSSTSSSS